MSNVMRGVGLAHILAEAFDNSEASFGEYRQWTDEYVNALTTKKGKLRILGPMLDVLRGDAEIVPKRRVIDLTSTKIGDKDGEPDSSSGQAVVVIDREREPIEQIRTSSLILGKFEVEVFKFRDYLDSEALDREALLPKPLFNRKLPGIAVRNFYLENPHHIPKSFDFGRAVLFWGTICKNNWCYYVPGILNNSKYGRRICTYKTIHGQEVLEFEEESVNDTDAAVLI